MNIGQIEVGKDYYGYDCIDNGAFRLIRYHVTEKATWSLKALRFLVSDCGDTPLASWAGYPDNLYATEEAAIRGLEDNVQKLINPKQKDSAPHMVNGVTVMACCDTCAHLTRSNRFCTEHNVYIDLSDIFSICREGKYTCNTHAINDAVSRVQVIRNK